MLNGYSIRKSAEIVEINIATSFYWRHKILNCISEFLGIGSEVYTAIKMGRKGIGIELKPAYFDAAVENIKNAEMEMRQATLFD